MAPAGSKRRTRKPHGSAPRAVASGRRAEREQRRNQARRQVAQANRLLGTVGERPDGIFGPVPVSEVAILAGLVALVIGMLEHGGAMLEVGIIVMALGVTEVAAREHFTGFRSHTTLLALMPAVVIEAIYALVIGAPSHRILLLVPVAPIFAVCSLLLRRQFRIARHGRVIGNR